MANKDVNILKISELDIDRLPPNNKNKHDETQGGLKLLVIGKPGCFASGTKVLMYDFSTKKIEDIRIGEYIMGPNSNWRRIESLCSGYEKMHRIDLEDSESLIVNDSHILSLWNGSEYIDIMVKDYLILSNEEKEKLYWTKACIGCMTIFDNFDTYQNLLHISQQLNDILLSGTEKKLDAYHNFRLSAFFEISIILRRELVKIILDEIAMLPKKFYLSLEIVLLARSVGIFVNNSIDSYTIPNIMPQLEKIGEYPNKFLPLKFEVTTVGTAKYFGFCIGDDNRFLLSDLSVVHNTGKSTMIKNLLYEKSDIFPYGIVQSGTEDQNHFYSDIFPPLFVHHDLNIKNIEEFIKRQKLAKKYLPDPWGLLLLDDVSDDASLLKNKVFHQLIKLGRHWKLWLIISIQYAIDLSAPLRQGIDGIFILRESSPRLRKILFENFGGVIGDYKLFCQLMDKLTEDRCALYIDNTSLSNKIEDSVFYYRANPDAIPKDFRFGCDDYWDFNEDRFDENHDEDEIF